MAKATNIHWHDGYLTRTLRFGSLGARGATVWFTGLPASGKSTIASLVEYALVTEGIHAYRLDGDNIRHGLNKNLGFSHRDRTENIRRIGEVARLFADSGCIALTAFISPYRVDRLQAREAHRLGEVRFFEVYTAAPVAVCEQRDPKGLFARARAGLLPDFTGVSAPYEPPTDPDLVLPTHEWNPQRCAQAVIDLLVRQEVLSATRLEGQPLTLPEP
jgi:adenylylsulfate kinase